MNEEDTLVGNLKENGTDVWQCHKTGLLYYFGKPRKCYVGFHSVNLGRANPTEKKKTKKSKSKKK